jgi:hypothetical protein
MIPNTVESRGLAAKYEQDRKAQKQAVAEAVAQFNVPVFDLKKASTGDHLFEDDSGNHYEARDIADAVIKHFKKT